MRPLDFNTIAALMGRPEKAMLTPDDFDVFPHPLIEKGFLVSAGRAGSIRCPCGSGHSESVGREVVHGTVCYSVCCSESGGFFQIPADDLRLWSIDIRQIMKEIQSHFACADDPCEKASGLWYLGEGGKSVAGFRRQVFFAERMTSAVEKELPEGSTQILIIGEENPVPTAKFKDRVFQMHDVLYLNASDVIFDVSIIETRLGGKVPDQKTPVVPKKGPRALRADMIKEILREHCRTARDAYWNSIGRERKTEILKRPTYQAIADIIKSKTGESVDQSTASRTITKSSDKELQLLWAGCNDIEFIKKFKRS